MKQLTQYIQEKLHISNYKDGDDFRKVLEQWLNLNIGNDIDYTCEIIEYYLEHKTFKSEHIEDVEDLLKYENEKYYNKLLTKIFKQFIDINQRQIQSLKKSL